MNEDTNDGAPSTDRDDLVRTIGTEIDEMGWRNLRFIERKLSPYSLTFPQVMVLSFLKRLGPDLEMSQIAEQSGIPASTITSIMDRLVKRGMAERQQGATDRRRITGSVTESGVKILQELEVARNDSLSTVMVDFTDEELAVILKLVNRWAEMMEPDKSIFRGEAVCQSIRANQRGH